MNTTWRTVLAFSALSAASAPAATLVAAWDFNNAGNIGQAGVGSDLVVEGTAPTHLASFADDNANFLTGVITTAGGTGNHLVATNPIGANGGGSFTNTYSLLFDVFSPEGSRSSWRSLLQTSVTNSNDGDLFIRNSDDQLGVGALSYSPTPIPDGAWSRIVLSVNLGTSVEGYLNGNPLHTYNADSVDGRFSLDATFLLFADEDNENAPMHVGTVALFDGALTAAEAAALGGAGRPVPEPSSALLAGLAAAVGLRRRRN